MTNRPCTYSPTCPKPAVAGSRCEDHAVQYERAASKDRRINEADRIAVYASRYWAAARRATLERDEFCVCRSDCCPSGCGRISTEADHIEPLVDVLAKGGDPFDVDNLQGLDHGCHARKTAREVWH